MSVIITLVCWQCGVKKDITVDGPPQFAFELAAAADAVGWKGVIDLEHSRSMVFWLGTPWQSTVTA